MDFGVHTYAVILAGGEGTRFAPLSTPDRPKQFLRIFNDRTLIQQTVDRLQGALPPQRVLVATNARYEALVRQQLPAVPEGNLILETAKRNTAPAIALAAYLLHARDPEAVMLLLPADHLILDRDAFLEVLQAAVELATREHGLMTLGVTPQYPATEYGYIQRGDLLHHVDRPAFRVARFVEKPDRATAERYLATEEYYWNSGMFVWEAATIVDEIRQHLPTMARDVGRPDFFARAESISIDYGVMERSQRAITIPCDIGWSDIGNWATLKTLVMQEGLAVDPDVQRYLDTLA